MQKQKKAFTLTEVLVATFIGALILGFIFVFLGDVIDDIAKSKKETRVLSSYLDLMNNISNYSGVYSSGSVIIDNGVGTGSDVYVMVTPNSETGILMGQVDLSNFKISTDTKFYKNSGFGFRELSNYDLSRITADSSYAYDLLFQKDKVILDFNVKDVQIESYNGGSLFEMYLDVNLDFNSGLKGENWDNIPKDNLVNFNVNF